MRQRESLDARPGAAELRHQLKALGLSRWLPVLASWLPHFDGWRSVYLQDESLFEDEVPIAQVCALLAGYVKGGRPRGDIEFSEDLAHLDVLTWRARHAAPGSRWNCLEEPFAAFAGRAEVSVWQYDTEYPPAGLVKHWLLGRLFVELYGPAGAGAA